MSDEARVRESMTIAELYDEAMRLGISMETAFSLWRASTSVQR